ncbi:MAG: energy-coupling factor transporter ATPase [Chloroflexota bacterium]|nr:energy-coupling factor transporter ATPase [Chloroflexota bacterium]
MPAPPRELLIAVRDLWHTYLRGTPLQAVALRGADFELAEREIAAIIGHTGSGKSTLAQHLNGLYRPQRGAVRVLGHDLADPSVDVRAVRRQVGLVVQFPEHQLFEPTVGDDVAFGPRRLGHDRQEVRRRVEAAMGMVGLGFYQFKDRYTFGLSGGELRRVAIAGVLAMEPRVLVLDEPTAGLDPRGRTELVDTLLRLRDDHDIAVVFVSHDMEEVAELAERVWVIAGGRTALSGTVRDVFRRGDELRQLGLGVPQVTRLMYALRDAGLDVPSDVVTVDEAEEAVLRLLGEGR